MSRVELGVGMKGFLLTKEQAGRLRAALKKRLWTEIVRDMVHDACFMGDNGPELDPGLMDVQSEWRRMLYREAAALLLMNGGYPTAVMRVFEGAMWNIDHSNVVKLSIQLENKVWFAGNKHIIMDKPPSESTTVRVAIVGVDALEPAEIVS